MESLQLSLEQNRAKLPELRALLIGKTISEAEGLCAYLLRVTNIDGRYLMVHENFCPSRLNVFLVDGLISDLSDFF